MSATGPHVPGAGWQPAAAVVSTGTDDASPGDAEPNNGGSSPVRRDHDRLLSAFEALLLSVVTVVVAWSGYAAATWGSHSSYLLARGQEIDTEATQTNLDARDHALGDLMLFENWFQARASGEAAAAQQLRERFGPELARAFQAWKELSPAQRARLIPTRMPGYEVAEGARAEQLHRQARATTEEARIAAENSDGYVRTTVFLASVLFLVGISGHFARAIRTAMLAFGVTLLCVALYAILQLPGLPG